MNALTLQNSFLHGLQDHYGEKRGASLYYRLENSGKLDVMIAAATMAIAKAAARNPAEHQSEAEELALKGFVENELVQGVDSLFPKKEMEGASPGIQEC